MEMWFSDEHTDNVKLSIRVDKQLFSAQSEFQRLMSSNPRSLERSW